MINTLRNNLSQKKPAALLVRFLSTTRKIYFNNVFQEVALIETKNFFLEIFQIFLKKPIRKSISWVSP